MAAIDKVVRVTNVPPNTNCSNTPNQPVCPTAHGKRTNKMAPNILSKHGMITPLTVPNLFFCGMDVSSDALVVD